MEQIIPDKLFFRIGEVCHLTGIKPYILRYWEAEFKFLKPVKNKSGQRVYKKKDVELILRIKRLLYDDLYTIAGAKKKIANDPKEDENQMELSLGRNKHIHTLKKIKGELKSIKELLS